MAKRSGHPAHQKGPKTKVSMGGLGKNTPKNPKAQPTR